MASETDIANRALSKLGETRILTMTDDSKPARAMLARFSNLRDAELAAHPWRFAVKRTTLAASTDTPAWGYSKIYELPVDNIRVLKVGDAPINLMTLGVYYSTSGYQTGDQAYEVIDGKIYTDMRAPLKLEYIARVTETGRFDPLFVEALACRLAIDAAEELTQSPSKADVVARQYSAALSEARRSSSVQQPPRRKMPGPFLQARGW